MIMREGSYAKTLPSQCDVIVKNKSYDYVILVSF